MIKLIPNHTGGRVPRIDLTEKVKDDEDKTPIVFLSLNVDVDPLHKKTNQYILTFVSKANKNDFTTPLCEECGSFWIMCEHFG